ncbi:MAG: phosphoribosylanthranilate isomerase [Saprospiraceae bacterium]|nr:phosphoribosylanthranilate isomerase [Saprospiraceae bacterium]
MNPQIKICCIQSIAEARLAIDHGASVIGLVGAMPSGPGPIDDRTIREIAAFARGIVHTFLLTSETTADGIISHHQRTGTAAIQIVDAVSRDTYAGLRAALPGIELVQVIHVTGPASLDEALTVAPFVDKLLLDSGNPHAAVKELGGTGRTHNWEVSRQIVAQSPVPVFLAGGLNADNVRQALETVQPYGVDLCSGVRTQGALNPVKLAAFMRAARGA